MFSRLFNSADEETDRVIDRDRYTERETERHQNSVIPNINTESKRVLNKLSNDTRMDRLCSFGFLVIEVQS